MPFAPTTSHCIKDEQHGQPRERHQTADHAGERTEDSFIRHAVLRVDRSAKPRPFRFDNRGFVGRSRAEFLEKWFRWTQRLSRRQLAWLPMTRRFAGVIGERRVIAGRFMVRLDYLLTEQLPIVSEIPVQTLSREWQERRKQNP